MLKIDLEFKQVDSALQKLTKMTNAAAIQILTEDLGMPEDDALSQLTNNSLDLGPYWENVTDDIVIAIAQNCPELTNIDLDRCSNVTDDAVIAIAQNCVGLSDIHLVWCWYITNNAVIAIAENCAGLTKINLNGCYYITDAAVIALAENCAGLTSVNLEGCEDITDAAIFTLSKNCEYLENILCCHTKVTSTGQALIVEIETRPKPPPLEEGWWMDDGTGPRCKGMMN